MESGESESGLCGEIQEIEALEMKLKGTV